MQVEQTLLLDVGMKRCFTDELDVIALKLSLLISIVSAQELYILSGHRMSVLCSRANAQLLKPSAQLPASLHFRVGTPVEFRPLMRLVTGIHSRL